MAQIYANLIKLGVKTIDNVPPNLKISIHTPHAGCDSKY